MTEHIKKSIQELKRLIRYHNTRYYVQDAPEISDKEWDGLFAELKYLETAYPEYTTKDSPTQRLEIGVKEEFTQAEHYSRLLSLDNTYNAEDLREFDQRVKKNLDVPLTEHITYTVELKYDGLSLALVYNDGKLVRATTRGNGIVGEDVTENVYTMNSVPFELHTYQGLIEVRGEVLMDKSAFEKLNQSRAEEGVSLFANPRNAASGSLRLLDTKETAKRNLSFYAYDITYEGPGFISHQEELTFLKSEGLLVGEYKVSQGISEVISLIEYYEQKRFDLPFEIDGLVIKVDSTTLKQELGTTEHHPRSQIAYKFPAIEEITLLETIEIQVGRTGVLTPVAHLRPVNIGGVMVARASLHNFDEIEKKDIRAGDHVVIKRAGDVIPYVVKSIAAKRNGTEQRFSMPTHCPICLGDVVQLQDEVAFRCMNINCSAQIVERLKYFVSKQAMDIDGFGGRSIETFVEAGIISTIEDIYTLGGQQEKMAKVLYADSSNLITKGSLFDIEDNSSLKLLRRILESVEESKKQPMHKVLTGFGIRFVGAKTAKILSKQVGHINDFFHFSIQDFEAIDGIGPVVAESLVDFFADEKNKSMIEHLSTMGLRLVGEKRKTAGGVFEGKTIVFTGTLTQMNRDQASKLAEEKGADVLSSVSKKLDYLVAGEKAGSKRTKAKQFGVIILSEKEFLSMMEKIG